MGEPPSAGGAHSKRAERASTAVTMHAAGAEGVRAGLGGLATPGSGERAGGRAGVAGCSVAGVASGGWGSDRLTVSGGWTSDRFPDDPVDGSSRRRVSVFSGGCAFSTVSTTSGDHGPAPATDVSRTRKAHRASTGTPSRRAAGTLPA